MLIFKLAIRSTDKIIPFSKRQNQPTKRKNSTKANVHCLLDRFHCHATKKYIGNRPLEEAKKIKCYKRLIYKQFFHVSGLCSPQFLSFWPKLFTHLCRALYEDDILVYRFGAQNMAAGKSTKTSGVHFSDKSSLFSIEN